MRRAVTERRARDMIREVRNQQGKADGRRPADNHLTTIAIEVCFTLLTVLNPLYTGIRVPLASMYPRIGNTEKIYSKPRGGSRSVTANGR